MTKLNNLINVVNKSKCGWDTFPVDWIHIVRFWKQEDNINKTFIWICYDANPNENFATTEGISVQIEYKTP